MARQRYTAEEIIGYLRTIEIEMGKGVGIAEACRVLGTTELTSYRCRVIGQWCAPRSMRRTH